MTHVRIIINGTMEFDGDGNPGEWTYKPPDFIKDLIKPGARPEPHMKAIMMAMTDAVIQKQSVNIEARTWADGWSMCVEEK